MPKLTQQSNPPTVPHVTPEEQDARSDLRRALELLWFLEHFLDLAKSRLSYPPDAEAEAMGSGEAPESLSFSLLGSIECAQTDHVDPLHNLLRDATQETPEHLIRDWRQRQKERK